MSNSKKIIGISGVARAGKDTFYLLSEKYVYEELGLSCKRYSLADALKEECEEYLLNQFNLDVYSQNPVIKDKFRPFLVWYGDRKREQTAARYFTDILEKKIRNDTDIDVAIITDIRYGEYPLDEVHWLKETMGGKLIHIQRTDHDENVIQPANDNERRNDPIMQEFCDYKLRWDSRISAFDTHFLGRMYVSYHREIKEFYSKVVKTEHVNDVAYNCAVDVVNSFETKKWRANNAIIGKRN